MCKIISTQQVNMNTIGCNAEALLNLDVEAIRDAQRSFGSSEVSWGMQNSQPYQRPSMRHWW